jgi:hypothetical protein
VQIITSCEGVATTQQLAFLFAAGAAVLWFLAALAGVSKFLNTSMKELDNQFARSTFLNAGAALCSAGAAVCQGLLVYAPVCATHINLGN